MSITSTSLPQNLEYYGQVETETEDSTSTSTSTSTIRRRTIGVVPRSRPVEVHKFPGLQRVSPAPTKGVTPRLKVGDPSLLHKIDADIAAFEAGKFVEDVPKFLGSPEMVFPGICMSDVARDTGLTIGGVSRIFNGMRKAKKHTLKSIANIYTDGDIRQVIEAIKSRVLLQVRNYDRFRPDRNRDLKLRILEAYDKTDYTK